MFNLKNSKNFQFRKYANFPNVTKSKIVEFLKFDHLENYWNSKNFQCFISHLFLATRSY